MKPIDRDIIRAVSFVILLSKSRLFLASAFAASVFTAWQLSRLTTAFWYPHSAMEISLHFSFGLSVVVGTTTLRSLIPSHWKPYTLANVSDFIIRIIRLVGLVILTAALLHGRMTEYNLFEWVVSLVFGIVIICGLRRAISTGDIFGRKYDKKRKRTRKPGA